MWVFGYGSLMWDSWDVRFNGKKYDHAKLANHQRDFNKASTYRWGTMLNPGPTLGLRRKRGSQCVGTAFHFDKSQKKAVLDYLSKREGTDFGLKLRKIILSNGRAVMAYTPVNIKTAKTFIGRLPIEKRALMVLKAKGTGGECYKYVKKMVEKLRVLGIEDLSVSSFLEAIQRAKMTHLA